MKDLKTPLLSKSTTLLPPRPLGQSKESKSAVDVLQLKKRGKGVRSWIRVDPDGNSQVLEVDKATIMRRCSLPARDLRLLDPHFVYPATILGREKALVLNLEHIRCIITADEVLLLNSFDSYVLQYVAELRRRLATQRNLSDSAGYPWRSSSEHALSELSSRKDQIFWSTHADDRQAMATDSDMFSGSSVDYLPFEFRALEVALEAGCTFLDGQAMQLEQEAYPVLDELTSKVSTLNLERVRRLKSRLVTLTRRVQKVRDEIEQLMDDDGDMAEMYLTHKMERQAPYFQFSESNIERSNSLARTRSGAPAGSSMSAPVSPVGSPSGGHVLEKSWSMVKSIPDSISKGSRSEEDVEELEMLLEAYFVVIDGTLNKLTSLKQYIDDTEDFINIQLDNVRNQLIQFELLLTTATFVVAVWGVIAGVFGMNIPMWLFEEPAAFKWVLLMAGGGGLLVFCTFLWFFKRLHLLP
ncbi:unnamed protein product [Calypogeia fissa]